MSTEKLLPDIVHLLSKAVDDINDTDEDKLEARVVVLNKYGEQIINLLDKHMDAKRKERKDFQKQVEEEVAERLKEHGVKSKPATSVVRKKKKRTR